MSALSFSNFLTVIILLLTFYGRTVIIIVCLKMFPVHSFVFYWNCLSVNLQQFTHVI